MMLMDDMTNHDICYLQVCAADKPLDDVACCADTQEIVRSQLERMKEVFIC